MIFVCEWWTMLYKDLNSSSLVFFKQHLNIRTSRGQCASIFLYQPLTCTNNYIYHVCSVITKSANEQLHIIKFNTNTMPPNQGMHKCAFKWKQTQPWSNNYMHNYSTVKNHQLTLKHQICAFLECIILAVFRFPYLWWAHGNLSIRTHSPGGNMSSEINCNHGLAELCCVQLNYIMNTEHRLSQSHTTLTLFLKKEKERKRKKEERKEREERKKERKKNENEEKKRKKKKKKKEKERKKRKKKEKERKKERKKKERKKYAHLVFLDFNLSKRSDPTHLTLYATSLAR